MSKHLKLHSFTGTSDHDFTGLSSEQIIKFDGTNVVSSDTISSLNATTLSGGTLYSGSTELSLLFAPIGTSEATTASNGLTESGDDIQLGGALTSDTFIDNAGFLLRAGSFSATTMSAQTIHAANIGGFSPINLTSTMELADGVSISAETGGGYLNLRRDTDSNVLLTTDGLDYGESGIEMYPDFLAVWGAGYNQALLYNGIGNESLIELKNAMVGADISLNSKNIGGMGVGEVIVFDNSVSGKTTDDTNKNVVVISSTRSTAGTGAANSSIIGGDLNKVNDGLEGVVIAGGESITAATSNTLYTQNARLAENSGVIYSAGTDLYNIFATSGSGIAGTGTNNTIAMWNGTSSLTDSIMTYDGVSGITVAGDVFISGNVEVLGTATTINTQDLNVVDNNILLNSGGTHTSALLGGISIEDGVSNGNDSNWVIDASGNWSANTSVLAQGLDIESGTMASGGTDLYNIFVDSVVGGTNVNATGTAGNPIINLDSDIVLTSVNATTLSGGTLYSGTTDISLLFAPIGTSEATTASNGLTESGDDIQLGGALTSDTFIDNAGFLLRAGSFSANTISAQTIHAANIGGFSPINLTSDMELADGVSISAETGGGHLNLRRGADNNVALTTDGGVFAESWYAGNTTDMQAGFGSNNYFEANAKRTKMRNTTSGTHLSIDSNEVTLGTSIALNSDSNPFRVYSVSTGHTFASTTAGKGVNINSQSVKHNSGINYSTIISASGGTGKTSNTLYTTQIGLITSGDDFEGILYRTALTADHTWILPDATGTVALTSDIPAGIIDGSGTAGTIPIFTDSDTIADSTLKKIGLGGETLTWVVAGAQFLVDTGSETFNLSPANGTLSHNASFLSRLRIDEGVVITANRTWDMPNADGTVALTSNITSAITRVAGGTNISTGGTVNLPIINLDADIVLTSVNATTLSGGTLYSGATDISDLFSPIGAVTGSGTDNTVPLWNGTTGLDDSILTQAGSIMTATGDMNVTGDVIVTGDFTVNGTTTTVNTQTLQAADNNIELNYSGNATSATGGGMTVLSGISAGNDATWLIDATGNWAANAGIQGTTVTATDFFAMTPKTGAVTSADDDAWFHSGATGTITMNYKVGGLVYSVELSN